MNVFGLWCLQTPQNDLILFKIKSTSVAPLLPWDCSLSSTVVTVHLNTCAVAAGKYFIKSNCVHAVSTTEYKGQIKGTFFYENKVLTLQQ